MTRCLVESSVSGELVLVQTSDLSAVCRNVNCGGDWITEGSQFLQLSHQDYSFTLKELFLKSFLPSLSKSQDSLKALGYKIFIVSKLCQRCFVGVICTRDLLCNSNTARYSWIYYHTHTQTHTNTHKHTPTHTDWQLWYYNNCYIQTQTDTHSQSWCQINGHLRLRRGTLIIHHLWQLI